MAGMASSPIYGARQTPFGSGEPRIQHSFDGDVKILNSTFDERMSLRKTLSDLQELLQRLEGHNVQIAAEIRVRVDGNVAKEHTYSVTVDDSRIDSKAFAGKFASSRHDGSRSSASMSLANTETNGRSASLSQSASRAREDDDDDVLEIRPPKKARIDGSTASPSSSETNALLREALSLLKQRNSNDTLEFVKQWHSEWVKQGGWLFDTLNGSDKLQRDNHTVSQTRLNVVQDVLGQSMNAAAASTMAELTNISKLVPWLEHCRKTAADKTQAREEKWRTSSATFHDHARKDRETAEKKLEDELQKQRSLLVKIAGSNGVDVDDEDDKSRGTREASLGAQLTAELDMEARRAEEKLAAAQKEQTRETINIDDDDP